MEKEFNTELTRKTQGKKKQKITSLAGWMILILAAVIVIPVGLVMFVLSGLWSAADRFLLKFSH